MENNDRGSGIMRAVILGSEGSIGKVHKKNLNLLGVEVVCVDKTLPECPDTGCLKNIDQYDFIIIATPTDTHLDLIHYLNSHGVKYIMCEKPLYTGKTYNEQIMEMGLPPACVEMKSQIYINNAYRFEEGMIKLKSCLPLVGQIRHASFENSYAFEKLHKYPYENYEGIIYDDVHIINSSRFIFGDPQEYLYSYITKDIAQFAWKVGEIAITHSTDIVGQRYKKRIEVKGDEGTLIYNFGAHCIWFEPKDESERRALPYKHKCHLFESLKYVIGVVESGGEFIENTIFDAIKDMECIKCLKSL